MSPARARAPRSSGERKSGLPVAVMPVPQRSPLGNQAVLRRLAHERAAMPVGHTAPPVVNRVLRGGGQPLDAGVRAYFERGLGTNLSAVRVHADMQADRSVRAVGALAFAVGPHLVFGAGRYAPSQPEGLGLLAHELAHVAQSPQTAPPSATLRIGDAAAPEERQAAMAARRLAEGARTDAQTPAGEPALRRQTSDDDPKKTTKPLIPLPVFDKLDIKPYAPLPGGSAPTPYDPPGKVPDISGGGPSMEDISIGAHTLLDRDTPSFKKHAGKMPSCSALETAGSTRQKRRYCSFEKYEQERRVFHDQMSKDPWPTLSESEYKSFIDACPKGDEPILKPDFPVEKPPLQDAPERTLPPGQAYA